MSFAVRSGVLVVAIEFDCSRISGLSVERRVLRAMMESAREEPIALLGLIGPRKLSAFPRVGPNRCAINLVYSVQSAVGDLLSVKSDPGLGCGVLAVGDGVAPHGPGDPSEFVGDGNRGLVVTPRAFPFEAPSSQPIVRRGVLGVPEDGSRAVDEEHSQVRVAALADGTEAADQPARVLAWGEPEVAGEVATGREPLDVADERDESGGGQEANARDGSELVDRWGLSGERVELEFGVANSPLELTDFVARVSEDGPERIGKPGLGVFQGGANGWQHAVSAEGDDDPELSEDAADGVDPGGSRGKPARTKAVECSERLLGD